jgi:hypothetical protein
MVNVIYRGPIKDQPETVSNKTVAGAYLPGIIVTEGASALTVATGSDMETDLLILSNADFAGQDVATAYTSGDTGVAYRPRPGELYQVRLAGATYAAKATLTVGASGYLEATSTAEKVVAYFEGTAGAITAGTLNDVRIANSFLTAAV